MTKEQEFILLGSVLNKNESEITRIDNLLSSDLDWVEIAGQLLNHRLGGYLYKGLNIEQKNNIPVEIREALRLLVIAQKKENIFNIEYLKPILNEFSKNNLHYVALKGLYFNASMYDMGIRRSNDIDILVPERNLKVLDDILRGFGYIQSFQTEGELVEAPKKVKLIQRIKYHDLVPYKKYIKGKLHEIDVNFTFDTVENEITQEVFENGIVEYSNNDYCIQGLPFETNLAFLCIHFFREGTNSLWTEGRRDVLLYKIVDIMNVVRKNKNIFDVRKWTDLMKKLNIGHKCYYTFYMLLQFYPNENFIKRILRMLEPDDKSFLFEVIVEGENKIKKRREPFIVSAFGHEKSY